MKSLLSILLVIFMFYGCKQGDVSSNVNQNSLFVLIDVSHGGKDPGAISKQGITEKELALDYSTLIATELQKNNINIMYTRTEDEFVSLLDRVQKADIGDIDAVISIHFNSSTDENKNGFKTYYKPDCNLSGLLDSLIHLNVSKITGMKDNGSADFDFYILEHSPVPAIIIEAGYLSSDEDMKRINSPSFKQEYSEAVAKAMKEYASLSKEMSQ